MIYGTVKWFSPQIGFGYVCPEDGGYDILVLGSSVARAGLSTLDVGQRIGYDLTPKDHNGRRSAIHLQTAPI